jgi:hypothetical protein
LTLPIGQRSAVGRTFIDLDPELAAILTAAIRAGWAIARSRDEVGPQADEVPMTECLRDGMREVVNSSTFDPNLGMRVAPGTESRSRPDLTTPDGRLDIGIYFFAVFPKEHDPHVVIECKRIAEDDARLIREYIAEGIDRFCSAKYSSNHSFGCMVGYVIRGSPEASVGRINQRLASRSRRGECLTKLIGPASGDSWASHHPRKASNPIRLSHVMLLAQ